MISYEHIFENNRQWVEEKLALDPTYFEKLSQGQSPHYLYIGCSDSRLPIEHSREHHQEKSLFTEMWQISSMNMTQIF